jgi:hypothetical protein
MKHIIVILIAGLIPLQPVYSQPDKGMSGKEYLRKSKQQRTTGIILFAGGTALVVTGIVLGSSNTDASDLDQGPNFDEGMWLVFPGVAMELASLPFFLSAAKNKRKAADVSLGVWSPPIPFALQRIKRLPGPAITLRFFL